MSIIKKDILIVLGNGFSIDLLKHMPKVTHINLSNLFRNGDKVPWPANNEPGFLSQYHCPELWKLGARPNIEMEKAVKLIDDIITCANVSASSEHPSINTESNNVYIRAYHELVIYFKYLFIYFNKEISDDDLRMIIDADWGWSSLLQNLNINPNVTSVTIVTYNYDILLERILELIGIKYQMVEFESEEQKFRILKPHGSISFRSKKEYDKESFSIKYNRDSLGGSISDLIVDKNVDFDKISNINTMVPPSGESGRYKLVWSNILRSKVIESVINLKEDDDVIFGGLSYCNVDRTEIDSIITALNPDVNIKIVNPDTNNTFGAVISSVFENYIHYVESSTLGGLYK